MRPSPPAPDHTGRSGRILRVLTALSLLALRLAFRPDPLDPVAWLLLAAALLAAHPGPAWRRVVIGLSVTALAILCIKAQMFHMLAVADLVP